MYPHKMFQLILNTNLKKLIMKGKGEEEAIGSKLFACKKAHIGMVMSQCIGLERALSNS